MGALDQIQAALQAYGDAMNQTSDEWAGWKHDNPVRATVLEMFPGSSATTALYDMNRSSRDAMNAVDEGNYPQAAGKAGETFINGLSGLTGIAPLLAYGKAAKLLSRPAYTSYQPALQLARAQAIPMKNAATQIGRREGLTEVLSNVGDLVSGVVDAPDGTYNPFR